MDSCPACGAHLPDGADVCPACGATAGERTASFAPVGGASQKSAAQVIQSEGPLLVVGKGPEVGERFYLDRPTLTIGRDPGSDIFLNDITVSRRHAVLTIEGGDVVVCDAGSLNGMYVNGATVDRAVLHNGDQLQVGRFQMVFLSGPDA
jgi:pSer/pThr/pTyr-binding forkhead associated (FHA) protein